MCVCVCVYVCVHLHDVIHAWYKLIVITSAMCLLAVVLDVLAVGGNKCAKVTLPWRAILEVQEGSHGGTVVSSNVCLWQMSINSQLSSAWRYLTIYV